MTNDCLIEVSGVNRIFSVPGGEFQALKDINVKIMRNTLTILKGRSGSGKTTLMNIIGALDAPSSGIVMIEGRALGKMSDREREKLRRKDMGFVFQAVSLIPAMNAFQNVEFSMRLAGIKAGRERDKRVEDCLKMVGLGNRARHMPAEMSGGEQQRVAIARALMNDPAVLLADEPSGNLDSRNREEIHRLFFDLRNRTGQTVVIVTHDEGLAATADRRIVMSDGRVL